MRRTLQFGRLLPISLFFGRFILGVSGELMKELQHVILSYVLLSLLHNMHVQRVWANSLPVMLHIKVANAVKIIPLKLSVAFHSMCYLFNKTVYASNNCHYYMYLKSNSHRCIGYFLSWNSLFYHTLWQMKCRGWQVCRPSSLFLATVRHPKNQNMS